jgi:hypothetical protein
LAVIPNTDRASQAVDKELFVERIFVVIAKSVFIGFGALMTGLMIVAVFSK